MSQLDELISRSRAPGTFVEKRSFTLARSKAIEKMREFSLRDPYRAVLELAQAAVFAGARWIAVDTSSDGLVVAWVGGKGLSRTELGELFDYLFADQGIAETRYLMQTAIGVNALLQRRPRRVRIESGDGTVEGTARMDLDRAGNGDVGVPERPLAGTYLFCEFGGGFFGRFTSVHNPARESELIETRCMYTPTPILLNGQAPFGYRTSRTVQLFGVKRAAQIEIGGRRGALGIPQPNVDPGVRLVVGGVWVTTREMQSLGPQLVGVIADDRLRKTADMSDIVEDARWVDMLHDIQPTATQLIRSERGSTYAPPRLPSRITESVTPQGPEEPALEPLPDTLPQLSPRTQVALTSLVAMDTTEPLFWVEPDVAESLVESCDPVRFPYRVVILSPGQARSVEATVGESGPKLSRLTHPEDVSFVRNAMERRHTVHAVQIDAAVHLEGEASPRTLPLELRLHLEGPSPRWDCDGPAGTVPVAIVQDKETIRCSRLDLRLHDISIVVDLTGQPTTRGARLEDALRQTVQREAWRLLPREAHGEDRWRRRLELTLLADHARPQFARNEVDHLELHLRFPSAWRSVHSRLRDAVIVDTTEGPLSLAAYVRAVQEGTVVTLAEASQRAQTESLEARFGFGHLVAPADLGVPLAAVGRAVESWAPRSGAQLGDPSLEELLLVFPAFATPDPPEGWRALPPVGPGIAHWVRLDGAFDAADLARRPSASAGAPALLTHLRALEQAEWVGRPSHVSVERAQAISKVAQLRLAARCGRLGEVRLADTTGRSHPVSTLLADRGARFVARGGATTDAEVVVPVSFTELCVLQDVLTEYEADAERADSRVNLLLDDPPDLWGQAPEEEARWLVTLPVDQAGLKGWLGLRLPYDPTPGVLLEATDHLEVLPGFTARVPCHGLLQLTGARRLSRAQTELLYFSGMQLYQRLLRRLDSDLEPQAHEAAHAYAARFAQRSYQRDAELRPGLARGLAMRVTVTTEEGRPWGTLADWLAASKEARPPAPPGIDTTPDRSRTGEVSHLADASTDWGFLAGPLKRALYAQLPGISVDVVEMEGRGTLRVAERSTASHCRLALTRTPLAARALHGDRLARGLLLMEATRVSLVWADRMAVRLDPLALQRAVLAARVSER